MLTDNEEREFRKQAEYGRKVQAVQEVMKDFLTEQRAHVIGRLETEDFDSAEALISPVLYLRLLRTFELEVEQYISLGKIAQRRLNEDGE